jgi:NTP pyrophosphatase (non-canonical NTP hydrolase)
MSFFNNLDHKTWKFNEFAGNNDKLSKKDFEAQYKCLVEEVNETGEGIETNNLEEILDGVVDILVVATGLAHDLDLTILDKQELLSYIESLESKLDFVCDSCGIDIDEIEVD